MVMSLMAVITTMRIPKMRLRVGPDVNVLVSRAPRKEPAAPTTTRTAARCRSTSAVEMCGTRAVNDGRVTATPVMPVACREFYLETNDGAPTNRAVKVTFYGTSTLLFDDGDTQIMVDAFITRPTMTTALISLKTGAALIKTDKLTVDARLARPEIGTIAAIFPAHSHDDHGIDVAYIANQTGAHVYGSESTLDIARGGGVPEAQLSRYELGKALQINRFTVTALPGRHPFNPPPLTDDRDVTIDAPLRQPAAIADYVEGGSFAFLIHHGEHSVLVQVPGFVRRLIALT